MNNNSSDITIKCYYYYWVMYKITGLFDNQRINSNIFPFWYKVIEFFYQIKNTSSLRFFSPHIRQCYCVSILKVRFSEHDNRTLMRKSRSSSREQFHYVGQGQA